MKKHIPFPSFLLFDKPNKLNMDTAFKIWGKKKKKKKKRDKAWRHKMNELPHFMLVQLKRKRKKNSIWYSDDAIAAGRFRFDTSKNILSRLQNSDNEREGRVLICFFFLVFVLKMCEIIV
jgi:hypothetical protein